MIRTVSERDQVLRLWNGVKPEIQSGLWRAQLNPEISNWEDVLAQAEIIEISENVAHKRDNRTSTTRLRRDSVFMPYFPVPRINPSNANFWSSRSMTFDLKWRKRDLRPPPSVNQASTSSRSGQSQQSRSFQPTSIPG